MCAFIFFVFCVVSIDLSSSNLVLTLNGNKWIAEKIDGSLSNISASVPGSIYTDLLKNGILSNGDPLYRMNDDAYRWVSKTAWSYRNDFYFPPSMVSKKHIHLECGGLDTVAVILINDRIVGRSDNMFKRYVFDVKSILKKGANTIQIIFESPILYSLDKAASYPYDVPPDCPSSAQNGDCHVNFIRKEQCSFSWDWGPSFPTVGIWRNITLKAFDDLDISYVTWETKKDQIDKNQWHVDGQVYFDIGSSNTTTITVPFIDIEIADVVNVSAKAVSVNDGVYHFSVTVPKTVKVSEWMPNGFGNQALYDLTVSVTTNDGKQLKKKMKIGFRTIDLVQEKIEGSDGLSFYFRINGRPIFMKGSNWIPADNLQERITEDYLRKLLISAKEANMNMLRVWGGGIYESEMFYNLADELGIMIWQDMMFACANYPTNKDYLLSVEQEIAHQVKELQHHASIAIWAGNNENEWGMQDVKTSPNYHQLYEDYVDLYINTVRNTILKYDQSRPFVPSSPSNGVETEEEGWVASNPQDERYGDVHHYDYSSDSWDWTVYPKPRFASEFGFQSWCSMETLEPVSVKDDWNWNSAFAQHRNHHPNGNQQMQAEFLKHFDLPSRSPSNVKTEFEDLIYLTQINQAMGIKTESELYRRLQGRLMDGKGHTMGALYWQLNDIWQAPTWASIEYGGKWKMLHYYARHFFNRVLISPVIEGPELKVYLVDDSLVQLPDTPPSQQAYHDLLQESSTVLRFKPYDKVLNREKRTLKEGSLTCYIYIYSFGSLSPVKTVTKVYEHPMYFGNNSQIIFQESVESLLKSSNCTKDDCFIYVSSELASNFVFFSYFQSISDKGVKKDPINSIAVMQVDDHTFKVEVKASSVALFVWLEVIGISGRFSDNGFHMVNNTKVIYYYTWEKTTVDKVRSGLTYKSLADVYL